MNNNNTTTKNNKIDEHVPLENIITLCDIPDDDPILRNIFYSSFETSNDISYNILHNETLPNYPSQKIDISEHIKPMLIAIKQRFPQINLLINDPNITPTEKFYIRRHVQDLIIIYTNLINIYNNL